MLDQIKISYRTARLAWRFLTREELKSPTPVPWRQRVSLLRRGFLSQAAELYNLKDYALEDYFSDWDKARMSMMYDRRNIRGGYQYGLNNKLFSTAILGQHLRVPAIYGVIEHGRVVPLDKRGPEMFAGSWSAACRAAGGRLVLKPSAEGRGRGVFVLSDRDGELLVDGSVTSEAVVQQVISGLNEYIIVEYLHQGQYGSRLYPDTVNTMRIVTVVDPLTQEPFLPIAVQRIGRASSVPVDNWNRGGLCAEVDLRTGTLSRAATRETPQRWLKWYDTHPDTGAPICGVIVPNWDAIQRQILDAASRIAYYKFLSWDVVLQDDGIAVIEADTVSGIETIQVHRPLLKDERLRRFLEDHGYVRPKSSQKASPLESGAQTEATS